MSARGGTSMLICDLTQSWSEVGGGVRTYLLHKRRHILRGNGDTDAQQVTGGSRWLPVETRLRVRHRVAGGA